MIILLSPNIKSGLLLMNAFVNKYLSFIVGLASQDSTLVIELAFIFFDLRTIFDRCRIAEDHASETRALRFSLQRRAFSYSTALLVTASWF